MAQDFLGVGWAEPVGVGGDGRIALCADEENVRQSILTILETAPGERRMRPDFGCGISRLVFAPNSTATAGRAAAYVQEALVRWEPRIEVLRVQGAPDRESGDRLLVEIEYRVISTNTVFNLVYPFYLTEGAGG